MVTIAHLIGECIEPNIVHLRKQLYDGQTIEAILSYRFIDYKPVKNDVKMYKTDTKWLIFDCQYNKQKLKN